MIISPTVAQVLRGVIHEMSTSLKDGLDSPVKLAQIDTIVGVLSATAVRAERQSVIVEQETTAIMGVAAQFVADGVATPELIDLMAKFDSHADEVVRYDSASEVLSAMSDIGRKAGDRLYGLVRELMTQRLDNENGIIGGGFEAAGRG